MQSEEISATRTPNDAASAAFGRAREILERSRQINGLAENEMYILRPTGASPFETEFVVMLQKKTFIGSRYSVPIGNWDRFLDAWNTGQPTSSDIYEDEMAAGSAATPRSSTGPGGRWQSSKPMPESAVISSASAPSFSSDWRWAPALF